MAGQFQEEPREVRETADTAAFVSPEVEPRKAIADLVRDDGIIISKAFRRYGRLIGRYPTQFAAVTLILELAIICAGWIPRLSGDTDLMNPVAMELQWSVAGSKLEKTIKTFKEQIGDDHQWGGKFSNTMFVPKKDPDGDIVTKDAFEEIFALYEKYRNMTVNVSGNEYGMFDVCKRGSIVDFPPGIFPPESPLQFGTPIYPCLILSPFSCFREELAMVHPRWKYFDESGAVSASPETGGLSMMNYSSRPSFREMTDKQIKETISAIITPENIANIGQATGCFAHMPEIKYYASSWGGKLQWNGTELLKAGGIRILFYMEGIGRAKYRMSETKKELGVLEDIEEAERLMSDKWHEICVEYNKNTKFVEVANIKDWAYLKTEIDDEINKLPWIHFIIGGVITMCYCAFALVSYRHPAASRANLGFVGLFVMLVSEITAFAAYFIVGLYLNPPMIVGLPLLALGLGMHDMIVLIRYFSNLGVEYITSHSPVEIVGEVLAQAGPGITLASSCNILTFGCGFFFPIPAMSDLCIGAALIAFFNSCTMLHLFTPIIRMEITRIQARAPDPHMFTYFCHKSKIAGETPTSPKSFSGCVEIAFDSFLRKKLRGVPPYVMYLLAAATFITAGGLVALSIYLIDTKEFSYAPQDFFENGSPERRGLELSFSTFSLFPAFLMFDGVDVANKQIEMLGVYQDIMASEWHAPYIMLPYLTLMTLTGTPEATPACKLPYQPNLLSNQTQTPGALTQKFPLGSANVTPSGWTNIYTARRRFSLACDTFWRDQTYSPRGLVPADRFDRVFQEWRTLPSTTQQKLWGWHRDGFYYADAAGVNQFVYDDNGKIKLSFFHFFQVFPGTEGRNNENIFAESIRDMHEAIDNSLIKDNVAAYGDIISLWEVFLELDSYLHLLIGIGAGVIVFIVTLLVLSIDVMVAFITAISCAMIVLEVYGIASALMSFNVFIVAFVVLGMGMAVEFTSHFAAVFSMRQGNARERICDGMADTFPAIIQGSISTLCGILPLVFLQQMFVLKYPVAIFAMVVGVGALNVLFIMPGLLALVSPAIVLVDKMRSQGLKSQARGEKRNVSWK